MGRKQLVVVTGFALHGKTTLAGLVARELGYHCQDIDKLQIDVFGWEGHPRPDPSLLDLSKLLLPLRPIHKASAAMLLTMAQVFLEENRSIVVCALSLSFTENQMRLQDIAYKTGAELKQIFCTLSNPSREEIERRIAAEPFGVGYNVRLATTFEQYQYALKAYVVPCLKHHVVDSALPLEECVASALKYIRSE